MSFNAKVYNPPGADRIVVDAGGAIDILPGGAITANGAQAANIAAPTGGTTDDEEARAAIVAILALLENAGLMAPSE